MHTTIPSLLLGWVFLDQRSVDPTLLNVIKSLAMDTARMPGSEQVVESCRSWLPFIPHMRIPLHMKQHP